MAPNMTTLSVLLTAVLFAVSSGPFTTVAVAAATTGDSIIAGVSESSQKVVTVAPGGSVTVTGSVFAKGLDVVVAGDVDVASGATTTVLIADSTVEEALSIVGPAGSGDLQGGFRIELRNVSARNVGVTNFSSSAASTIHIHDCSIVLNPLDALVDRVRLQGLSLSGPDSSLSVTRNTIADPYSSMYVDRLPYCLEGDHVYLNAVALTATALLDGAVAVLGENTIVPNMPVDTVPSGCYRRLPIEGSSAYFIDDTVRTSSGGQVKLTPNRQLLQGITGRYAFNVRAQPLANITIERGVLSNADAGVSIHAESSSHLRIPAIRNVSGDIHFAISTGAHLDVLRDHSDETEGGSASPSTAAPIVIEHCYLPRHSITLGGIPTDVPALDPATSVPLLPRPATMSSETGLRRLVVRDVAAQTLEIRDATGLVDLVVERVVDLERVAVHNSSLWPSPRASILFRDVEVVANELLRQHTRISVEGLHVPNAASFILDNVTVVVAYSVEWKNPHTCALTGRESATSIVFAQSLIDGADAVLAMYGLRYVPINASNTPWPRHCGYMFSSASTTMLHFTPTASIRAGATASLSWAADSATGFFGEHGLIFAARVERANIAIDTLLGFDNSSFIFHPDPGGTINDLAIKITNGTCGPLLINVSDVTVVAWRELTIAHTSFGAHGRDSPVTVLAQRHGPGPKSVHVHDSSVAGHLSVAGLHLRAGAQLRLGPRTQLESAHFSGMHIQGEGSAVVFDRADVVLNDEVTFHRVVVEDSLVEGGGAVLVADSVVKAPVSEFFFTRSCNVPHLVTRFAFLVESNVRFSGNGSALCLSNIHVVPYGEGTLNFTTRLRCRTQLDGACTGYVVRAAFDQGARLAFLNNRARFGGPHRTAHAALLTPQLMGADLSISMAPSDGTVEVDVVNRTDVAASSIRKLTLGLFTGINNTVDQRIAVALRLPSVTGAIDGVGLLMSNITGHVIYEGRLQDGGVPISRIAITDSPQLGRVTVDGARVSNDISVADVSAEALRFANIVMLCDGESSTMGGANNGSADASPHRIRIERTDLTSVGFYNRKLVGHHRLAFVNVTVEDPSTAAMCNVTLGVANSEIRQPFSDRLTHPNCHAHTIRTYHAILLDGVGRSSRIQDGGAAFNIVVSHVTVTPELFNVVYRNSCGSARSLTGYALLIGHGTGSGVRPDTVLVDHSTFDPGTIVGRGTLCMNSNGSAFSTVIINNTFMTAAARLVIAGERNVVFIGNNLVNTSGSTEVSGGSPEDAASSGALRFATCNTEFGVDSAGAPTPPFVAHEPDFTPLNGAGPMNAVPGCAPAVSSNDGVMRVCRPQSTCFDVRGVALSPISTALVNHTALAEFNQLYDRCFIASAPSSSHRASTISLAPTRSMSLSHSLATTDEPATSIDPTSATNATDEPTTTAAPGPSSDPPTTAVPPNATVAPPPLRSETRAQGISATLESGGDHPTHTRSVSLSDDAIGSARDALVDSEQESDVTARARAAGAVVAALATLGVGFGPIHPGAVARAVRMADAAGLVICEAPSDPVEVSYLEFPLQFPARIDGRTATVDGFATLLGSSVATAALLAVLTAIMAKHFADDKKLADDDEKFARPRSVSEVLSVAGSAAFIGFFAPAVGRASAILIPSSNAVGAVLVATTALVVVGVCFAYPQRIIARANSNARARLGDEARQTRPPTRAEVERDADAEHPAVARHFGVLYDGVRYTPCIGAPRSMFFVFAAEVITSISIAVLSSLRQLPCIAANVVGLIVSIVYLAYVVFVRPYEDTAEAAGAVGVAIVQLALCLCSVATVTGVADVSADIFANIALAGVLVLALQLIAVACLELFAPKKKSDGHSSSLQDQQAALSGPAPTLLTTNDDHAPDDDLALAGPLLVMPASSPPIDAGGDVGRKASRGSEARLSRDAGGDEDDGRPKQRGRKRSGNTVANPLLGQQPRGRGNHPAAEEL